MKKLYKLALWALLAGGGLSGACAQSVAPFKAGDRVVFTGNSITDGGHYHSYIWLYYLTRFPQMPIKVFNAGIGGDVARQIDERLQDDVLSRRPTVITLTFGMNDTGYQFLNSSQADSVYRQRIAASYQSFQNIERKLLAYPQARVIMIGSSPYDETSKIKARPLIGKNEAILKIGALQKQAAEAHHWGFLDFNRPMTAINRREQQRDSAYTMEGADRIHPTNDGHMVMAYLFLKAQGLAGKKVAEASLNASNGKILAADNCTLSQITATAGKVSFSYLAKSLPYPADTIPQGGNSKGRSQADGLKLVPFTQDFNQEILKVAGLKAQQQYTLTIDSTLIGTWTGRQLQEGINLALYPATPQYQQALAVMHLNEERWQIERRLREYYWLHYSILKPHGLLYNDKAPTMDSLERYAKKDFFVAVTLPTYRMARLKPVRETWAKEIELLTQELYHINQPRSHRVSIQPAKS